MNDLVSTEWLAGQLGRRDLRILDATLTDAATAPGRDAAAEFAAAHIDGAVFLDLAELRDTNRALPNMMPPPAKLASRLRAAGVGDGDRVVLYDDAPTHSSARAWWMLREFGLRDVAILDGGLAKWRAEGRPVVGGTATLRPRHFTVRDRPAGVRTLEEVRQALLTGEAQLVDARSPARFSGDEPDPRPGIAPGHMPGARNLHYARLFEADGTWKRGDALAAAFADAGVDLNRRVITTCGSGITAAALSFGLHLLGYDSALYDGSWSEWGADPDTPKAMGPA